MKDKIVEALAKLLNVKSLVTIALTVGFIVQTIRGQLQQEYTSVYLVVISFYFGTQYQKKTEEDIQSALYQQYLADTMSSR